MGGIANALLSIVSINEDKNAHDDRWSEGGFIGFTTDTTEISIRLLEEISARAAVLCDEIPPHQPGSKKYAR